MSTPTPTPTATAHLASMMHVLAPGVLSGGYKDQSKSALANATGHHIYMTGGEGFAFIVIFIIAVLVAGAVAVVLNLRRRPVYDEYDD